MTRAAAVAMRGAVDNNPDGDYALLPDRTIADDDRSKLSLPSARTIAFGTAFGTKKSVICTGHSVLYGAFPVDHTFFRPCVNTLCADLPISFF